MTQKPLHKSTHNNKHTHIEVALPAVLPLGVVKHIGSESPCIAHLGIALQHPPVQIFAQVASQITVTGPRADIAAAYLKRFVTTSPAATKADIQIELAIPAYLGLGSEPIMGIGVAKTLLWLNQQPHEDVAALAHSLSLEAAYNLELWGATGGGLLLVDTAPATADKSPLLWRAKIHHADNDAWGFVLVMPRVPEATPSTIEADRRAALSEVAQVPGMAESGELFETVIQPAVEQDDIVAFGQGLMALQSLNHRALVDAGRSPMPTTQDRAVLSIMQEQGALAWGQSPDGLALYALTKGARATIEMRTALRKVVSHTDGHMLATITNNRGAWLVERDGALPTPPEMRPA